MENKKAISDVVTTVLIILFAIIAVIIVGGIVLNQINKAGKNVDKQSVCTENAITPTSCTITKDTNGVYRYVRINFQRDKGKNSLASLVFTRIMVDGTTGTSANPGNSNGHFGVTNPNPAVGGVSDAYFDSAIAPTFTPGNTKEVYLTANYWVRGSSGDTISCESAKMQCVLQ